ncbi:MAG: MucR family transcriptional regulator, partial [Devosia sp.]
MEASAPGAGSSSNSNGRAADPLVELSASLVGAYVSHNALSAGDLPRLIAQVHQALSALGGVAQVEAAPEMKPAVPVKKSITPDHLICL